MTYQLCEVAADGPLLTVTINRPEKRNALNRAASDELHAIFDHFERTPSLRVAIITGAGDRAFCAGADLRSGDPRSEGATTAKTIAAATPPSGFGGLVERFDRTKPVIAAVNGFAVGGGFEIALACDLIVAADHAMFGLPEPRRGLLAGSGGIQRLIREIGPKRANALILTGRMIPAAEALGLGIVNEVVPAADLMEAARRWADDILLCSPTALRAAKAVADAAEGQTVETAIATMWDLPHVRAVFESPDSTEGPLAFAERRPPQWADV